MSHQHIENKVCEIEPEEARTKKNKSDKNCLIKKKFQFISAFDKKGAQHFLHSKQKALEKIIIEDEDIIDNENKNVKAGRSYSPKKKLDKYKSVTTNVVNNISPKNTYKRKIHQTELDSKIHTIHSNKNCYKDVLNCKKHKFYSSHELKMFGDKEIKKIKSIKKAHKKKSKKKVREEDTSFNLNDNSIFDILTQLK
jgi:hypothetical protein